MPAGVATASDEAGRGVPGPTTDRSGVSRRGGVGGTLELLRSGDGVRRAASWRVWREPWAKEACPTRRLGQTRRTRLELDDPFERVNVDDSVAALLPICTQVVGQTHGVDGTTCLYSTMLCGRTRFSHEK